MSINVTSGDNVNISVSNVETEKITVVNKNSASISVTGLAGGSDSHFVYTQSTPESVWEVTHSLNKKPSVTVVDSADTVVIGEVEYLSSNAVRLTFVGAFSGKAYFN